MKRTLYDTASDARTFAAFNELLSAVVEQTKTANVQSILRQATDLLGCTASVFATFLRTDEDLESYRFIAACSPAWCQLYAQRRWYMNDHFLQYARNNNEPILADAIVPQSVGQMTLATAGREHGFRSSMIVPFHSSLGRARMGVLYIGSDREGYFTPNGFQASSLYLRGLAHVLGEWWIKQIRQELLSGAKLSEADTVLLKYVHEACPSKEIATLMGITVNTVDLRLSRIAGRLGVPNRRLAARLAYDMGLLE